MSSHSNLVTLLHSSHTAARSWIACLPAIPLWPHWWRSQQHQAPVWRVALSLWGQHYLSHNKALPLTTSIPWPAVSTSMGRQPHTACRSLAGSNRSCPDTGSQQCLEPLCQAILPLRFLDPVSSKPGCPHTRPTSSPESATTPTGYNHHGIVRDPTA